MSLGRRIDERRLAVGLSQAELARRVGVRQSTINSLINGDSRSSRSLFKLARELRTSPAYLLGETEDPDANAPPLPAPLSLQHISLAVALPSEPRLAEAFRALLMASEDMSRDELARELARRLPIVLRAAASGALSAASVDDDDLDEPDEGQATALPAARRAAGR